MGHVLGGGRGPLVGIGLAAGFLAACDIPVVAPSSLDTGPRILAIAAEPPVVEIDTPEVVFTPLVVDAAGRDSDGDLDIEVSWRVCSPWQPVFDPDRDCPPDDALLLTTTDGAEGTARYQARVEPLAVFLAFPPPEWLDLGAVAPGGGGDGGPSGEEPGGEEPGGEEPGGEEPAECASASPFEVPVVLEARLGDYRLVAIKRVGVALGALSRQNPTLDRVELGADNLDVELDSESLVSAVAAGCPHSLGVSLDRASVDSVCDEDGNPALEAVRIHAYVTGGSLGDPFVDVEHGDDGTESAERTVWTTPVSGEATLWLIAIDGDGGVSWNRVDYRADADAVCQ